MPIYTYKCKNCNKKFEVNASIKEKEQGSDKFFCPDCKSKDVKQVFSLKSLFIEGKGDTDCSCSGSCNKK